MKNVDFSWKTRRKSGAVVKYLGTYYHKISYCRGFKPTRVCNYAFDSSALKPEVTFAKS